MEKNTDLTGSGSVFFGMKESAMREQLAGIPLYTTRVTPGVQRPRSSTPKFSGRYAWRKGNWVVFVEWRRWEGFFFSSSWQVSSGWPGHTVPYPSTRRISMKKWAALTPEGPDPNRQPATSVVLKKFPRLVAFLSDRWYDDNTTRLPGSMWVDSDFGAWKAMLKEPSLALCARIRAASLDDLFAAIETFLGLDAPPWEPDAYAASKAAPKKKK